MVLFTHYVKKIKGAAYKNGVVDATCKQTLTILTLLLLKMRVMRKLIGRTRIEVMTPTARDLHDTSINPNSPVYCTREKGI